MSKLDEAIAVIKAGDIEHGRRLLVEVLDEDPRNAKAWLWMSGVVSDPERRRQSLLAVLEIEPDNEIAKLGLEKFGWLEAETVAESPPPAPVAEELAYAPDEEAAALEDEAEFPMNEEPELDFVLDEEEPYHPPDMDETPEAEVSAMAEVGPVAEPETAVPEPVDKAGRGARFTWWVIGLLVLLLVVVLIVATLL